MKTFTHKIKGKHLLPAACLIASLSLPLAAQAEIEIYGGATTGGQTLNYGPISGNGQIMQSGSEFGLGFYQSVWNNWELGVDYMRTSQDYKPGGTATGATLSTESLMAQTRYVFNGTPNFTPYFGFGAGIIDVKYEQPSSSFLNGNQKISGGQLELGGRSEFPAFDLIYGIKYQAGFDQAYIKKEYVEYNSLGVFAGLRF